MKEFTINSMYKGVECHFTDLAFSFIKTESHREKFFDFFLSSYPLNTIKWSSSKEVKDWKTSTEKVQVYCMNNGTVSLLIMPVIHNADLHFFVVEENENH